MRFNDEFLLSCRTGSVPRRPSAGPDRWTEMYAEAERHRLAQVSRPRRGRSRPRLALARLARATADALEGGAGDQLRQR